MSDSSGRSSTDGGTAEYLHSIADSNPQLLAAADSYSAVANSLRSVWKHTPQRKDEDSETLAGIAADIREAKRHEEEGVELIRRIRGRTGSGVGRDELDRAIAVEGFSPKSPRAAHPGCPTRAAEQPARVDETSTGRPYPAPSRARFSISAVPDGASSLALWCASWIQAP